MKKLIKESLNEFVLSNGNSFDDEGQLTNFDAKKPERLVNFMTAVQKQYQKNGFPVRMCCWELDNGFEIKQFTLLDKDTAELTVSLDDNEFKFFTDPYEDHFIPEDEFTDDYVLSMEELQELGKILMTLDNLRKNYLDFDRDKQVGKNLRDMNLLN